MGIFQVAIDGPVASGKGTVARMLARKFGLLCLDTGALYRGVTVYFLDHEIDINDPVSYNRALGSIELSVKCIEGASFVFLNGEDITKRIRSNEVSVRVPHIAKLPEVRAKVFSVQQQVGAGASLVCEGRDITSVVFPSARFKFYLTASVKERAKRRFNELKSKGEEVAFRELERQISDRDRADMTRELSPLVCVPDAVKIDATKITAYRVAKKMEKIITKALQKSSDINRRTARKLEQRNAAIERKAAETARKFEQKNAQIERKAADSAQKNERETNRNTSGNMQKGAENTPKNGGNTSKSEENRAKNDGNTVKKGEKTPKIEPKTAENGIKNGQNTPKTIENTPKKQ